MSIARSQCRLTPFLLLASLCAANARSADPFECYSTIQRIPDRRACAGRLNDWNVSHGRIRRFALAHTNSPRRCKHEREPDSHARAPPAVRISVIFSLGLLCGLLAIPFHGCRLKGMAVPPYQQGIAAHPSKISSVRLLHYRFLP